MINTQIINMEVITNDTNIYETLIGTQGVKGATGERGVDGKPFTYQDLTEQQKQDLLGDVGNTTTNYANIFLTALNN